MHGRNEQGTEKDEVGRQVASAYRAGLADARRQVLEWADEQMQALPDWRTGPAHGKAELLGELRGFVAVRAEQTAERSAPPGRVEWGHRYPSGSVISDSSETVARSRAVISAAQDGVPLVLMRRTVTDWEEVRDA